MRGPTRRPTYKVMFRELFCERFVLFLQFTNRARVGRSSKLHKQPGERETPVPAKARPGLHRGGWAGTLLSRQRDRHHARHCASNLPQRDAEVPISTQSADEMHRCRVAHNLPHLSPVGINRDAHRIGSRTPLGLDPRAAELPICIPMVCPISQTAGRHLPAYPFPLAGLMACCRADDETRWFRSERALPLDPNG